MGAPVSEGSRPFFNAMKPMHSPPGHCQRASSTTVILLNHANSLAVAYWQQRKHGSWELNNSSRRADTSAD